MRTRFLKEHSIPVLASLILAILFFAFWPIELIVDDGAIVLKYMDNFAKGHFYAYNAEDGPVFGISGFIHGVLAGALAYSGLLSPTGCLLASNFIGVFLTGFFSWHLLSRYTSNRLLLGSVWLFALLSAPAFLETANIGLETPLHIAIVLACILAFLNDRSKWMWSLSVLTLISKLDAAPIVGFLCIAFLVRRLRDSGVNGVIPLIRELFLFGILPGVAWLAFTFSVFGSPLPQSAYAKVYYFKHPAHHWFPFLQGRAEIIVPGLLCAGLAWFACFARSLRGKFRVTEDLILGIAVIAYLVLFYFYNPLEQMTWYYALPELFLRLQLVVLLLILGQRFLGKAWWPLVPTACVALGLIAYPRMARQFHAQFQWRARVDRENIAIGEWIHRNSDPGDKLVTTSGHIARAAQLYTIDATGLNSAIVTDQSRWGPRRPTLIELGETLEPRWVAQTSLINNQASEYGYVLRSSYYNLAATVGRDPWRLFELRKSAQPTYYTAVAHAAIVVDGVRGQSDPTTPVVVRGKSIRFDAPGALEISGFSVGVVRMPTEVVAEILALDSQGSWQEKNKHILERYDLSNPGTGLTSDLVMAVPDDDIRDALALRIDFRDRETNEPLEMDLCAPAFATLLPPRRN